MKRRHTALIVALLLIFSAAYVWAAEALVRAAQV